MNHSEVKLSAAGSEAKAGEAHIVHNVGKKTFCVKVKPLAVCELREHRAAHSYFVERKGLCAEETSGLHK